MLCISGFIVSYFHIYTSIGHLTRYIYATFQVIREGIHLCQQLKKNTKQPEYLEQIKVFWPLNNIMLKYEIQFTD